MSQWCMNVDVFLKHDWKTVFLSYLGVDTGVTGLGTAITPGHNTLELTIAHHRATRVTLREREIDKDWEIERVILIGYFILNIFLINWISQFKVILVIPLNWGQCGKYLARVLASLQVSSAEHGVGDHARVGVVTVAVGQDGDVQALKLVLVSGCNEKQTERNGRMERGRRRVMVIYNVIVFLIVYVQCL